MKVSVKVFDRELSSKGRDLPDLRGPADSGKASGDSAPRADAKKHSLEEARPSKVINREEEADLRKSVLKRSGVLKKHLARINSAGLGSRDVILESWKREKPLGQGFSVDEVTLIDEISVSPRGDEHHYYLVQTYPDTSLGGSSETYTEAKRYMNYLKDKDRDYPAGKFIKVATCGHGHSPEECCGDCKEPKKAHANHCQHGVEYDDPDGPCEDCAAWLANLQAQQDLNKWLEKTHQEREDSRDMGMPY